MTTTYYPTGERLLVQRFKPTTKIGSIHLPDSAIEKTYEGIVIAIGDGETDISEGNHILFTNYAAESVVENLIMVSYEDVVATVLYGGSFKAGRKYTLCKRIDRGEKSTGGIIVPRRTQEETDAAVIYDPGIKGLKEDLKEGDVVAVRQNCGVDFTVGDTSFTAFDMDNDEIFGIVEDFEQLDVRNY